MNLIPGIQCGSCMYFGGEQIHDEAEPGQEVISHWVCEAFPKGIPFDFLQDKKPHKKNVKGDQGLTFEAKSPEAAQAVSQLFK